VPNFPVAQVITQIDADLPAETSAQEEIAKKGHFQMETKISYLL